MKGYTFITKDPDLEFMGGTNGVATVLADDFIEALEKVKKLVTSPILTLYKVNGQKLKDEVIIKVH